MKPFSQIKIIFKEFKHYDSQNLIPITYLSLM
jgi:hypothetical protein